MKTQTMNKNKYHWLFSLLPVGILSFITVATYWPSLHYDFQFDDLANITKHFNIRHYQLKDLFFSGTRWISYWINAIHFSIGRFNPFSYRVGNVLIHLTNGLLIFTILYIALKQLKKESFFKQHAYLLALITSALFLLHPVQTQTVTYVIQGELEGIALLCTLSIILLFTLRTMAKTTLMKYFFTGLLLCVSILISGTKEIAIVSPLLLLLFDWFFIAQGSWEAIKNRILVHGMVFGIVELSYLYLLKPSYFTSALGLQLVAQNNIGNIITNNPNDAITPLGFFISQFKVILHYIMIFFWPFNISVEYDWKLAEHFFAPDCILPFSVLVGIACIVIKRLRANPIDPVSFCLLWFAITIAPRSSIIPSPELIVDYKTYPACLGILLLMSATIVFLMKKIKERVKVESYPLLNNHFESIGMALLAIPLCFMTIRQNQTWSSGLKFWGNILKVAPNKARAYNNYGVELSQTYQKFKESIPYFKQAMALADDYPDPCNNLAVAYAAIGDIDRAIPALQRSLRINPYYPEGYNNLASFFMHKKDYKQAKEALETALQLRPYYGKAYFNYGRLYMLKNKPEKAWPYLKKCCCEGDLDNEVGFNAYAECSFLLKKYEDAIEGYNKVLELNPLNYAALFNLANAYFMTDDFEHAAQTYKEMLYIDQDDMRIYYNLGETYYKMNDYSESLTYFKKAQDKTDQPIPQLLIRIASCYEHIHDIPHAKETLEKLLTLKNVPEPIIAQTKHFLSQLELRL